MSCADALGLATAEKENALHRVEDLEARVATLKEKLQTAKRRQKEESIEAVKREDSLTVWGPRTSCPKYPIMVHTTIPRSVTSQINNKN